MRENVRRPLLAMGIVASVLVACDRHHVTNSSGIQTPCAPISPAASTAMDLTWSPDGAEIAFFGGRDSSGQFAPGIYAVDTLGGERRTLLPLAMSPLSAPRQLAWSPSGAQIAFVSGSAIFTLDVATRAIVQRTDGTRDVAWPRWSPDGTEICYTRSIRFDEPDSLYGLYVLSLVSGLERRFEHDGVGTVAGGPVSFSPYGTRLTFASYLSTGAGPGLRTISEVFVVGVDGANYRRVTHLEGDALHAQWLEDGSAILFDFSSCELYVGAERWTLDASGTGTGVSVWPAVLGDSYVQFGFPCALSPDGSHAAFVGRDSFGTRGVIKYCRLDGRAMRQLTTF